MRKKILSVIAFPFICIGMCIAFIGACLVGLGILIESA